jgi:hypothetical protein
VALSLCLEGLHKVVQRGNPEEWLGGAAGGSLLAHAVKRGEAGEIKIRNGGGGEMAEEEQEDTEEHQPSGEESGFLRAGHLHGDSASALRFHGDKSMLSKIKC